MTQKPAHNMVRSLLNTDLDDDTLAVLYQELDHITLDVLYTATHVPDSVALKLIERDEETALAIADCTDSPAVLAHLASHASTSVRRTVAANAATSTNTIASLWARELKNPSYQVVRALADRVPVASLVDLWKVRDRLKGQVHVSTIVALAAQHPIAEVCEMIGAVDDVDQFITQLTSALLFGTSRSQLSDDLVAVYEAIPPSYLSARKYLADQVAENGPINQQTLGIIDGEPIGSLDHRTVDDATLIELLKDRPLNLFKTHYTKTTPRVAEHAMLATFLLENAARFPERALAVLQGKLVPMQTLETGLIESAVREIPVSLLNPSSGYGFWPEFLFEVGPYADDVVVKALRYQTSTMYRPTIPTLGWLSGGFPAQPPTVEVVRELANDPHRAFNAEYLSVGMRDAAWFFTSLLTVYPGAWKYLGTIPSMLDTILDVVGPGWTDLLTVETVAAHVVARLAAHINSDNALAVLRLVERSRTDFATTIRTVERMYQ